MTRCQHRGLWRASRLPREIRQTARINFNAQTVAQRRVRNAGKTRHRPDPLHDRPKTKRFCPGFFWTAAVLHPTRATASLHVANRPRRIADGVFAPAVRADQRDMWASGCALPARCLSTLPSLRDPVCRCVTTDAEVRSNLCVACAGVPHLDCDFSAAHGVAPAFVPPPTRMPAALGRPATALGDAAMGALLTLASPTGWWWPVFKPLWRRQKLTIDAAETPSRAAIAFCVRPSSRSAATCLARSAAARRMFRMGLHSTQYFGSTAWM